MTTNGFLAFAIGAEYLRLAYVQALSIKRSQIYNNYCVVIDSTCRNLIETKHREVFDKIIVLDHVANGWDMTQDWQAYSITPWDNTILLDADILFFSDLSHWWNSLNTFPLEVRLSDRVIDFRGNVITSRKHRKLFDGNLLPDTYAGMMYFRKGRMSSTFFYYAEKLTKEWDDIVTNCLRGTNDKIPKRDEVFSVAARMVGEENVRIPLTIPYFVHCKEGLWGLSDQVPWYKQLYVQWDERETNLYLRVGNYIQNTPFHYHHKEWLTDDIIERYERYYKKLSRGLVFG